MSAPAMRGSSGAAESGEEALVVGDDAGDVLRIGCWVPDVALERAAQQDAIAPGKHVPEFSLHRVADLRLRLDDRKLPADRLEQLVAEQLAAPEASAVEHQILGQ